MAVEGANPLTGTRYKLGIVTQVVADVLQQAADGVGAELLIEPPPEVPPGPELEEGEE